MLNLLDVQPGQHVRLKSGATCEVLENIGDGIWLQLRVTSHPSEPGEVGTEDLVHCEEIVGLADESAA